MAPNARLLAPAFLVLLSTFFFTGCSGNHGLEPGSTPYKSLAQGAPVSDLVFVRQDLASDQRWSAHFERTEAAQRWLIATYASPNAAPAPLDRRANTKLINHLLDALSTLRIARMRGESENAALAADGLTPPRFALQWTIHDATGDHQQEVRCGDLTPERDARFMLFPSLDPARIYSASGAAIGLLGAIATFRELRAPGWTEFRADDVDELTVIGPKRRFYTQRDGDHWADRSHRALKAGAVETLLTLAVEARVAEYIDSPPASRAALDRISRVTELEIELRGRGNRLGLLRLSRTPPDLRSVIHSPWLGADFLAERAPGFAFGASAELATEAKSLLSAARP